MDDSIFFKTLNLKMQYQLPGKLVAREKPGRILSRALREPKARHHLWRQNFNFKCRLSPFLAKSTPKNWLFKATKYAQTIPKTTPEQI